MQKEKIAAVLLVIIIVTSAGLYFLYPETVPGIDNDIESGDCIDINYIGRYASNDEIFSSSYDDPESKTGGTPLKIFVTDDMEAIPPDDYLDYITNPLMVTTMDEYLGLALSPIGIRDGFIDELVALNKGDPKTFTTAIYGPGKGFGRSLQIGDIINATSLFIVTTEFKIVGIKEDVSIPELYTDYFGNGTTTEYTLRDETHYLDEIIETKYVIWDNSTVVTKINETLLWMYTTPTDEVGDNITWIEDDEVNGLRTEYPVNKSTITSMNDSTIVITHNPDVGDTIDESFATPYGYYPNNTYAVESLTADKINVSYTDALTGELAYKEIDRILTIERNETMEITEDLIGEVIEVLYLVYLRHYDGYTLSYNTLTDKDVYFEITIENIYKTSQEES